jgi:hypothetical protein
MKIRRWLPLFWLLSGAFAQQAPWGRADVPCLNSGRRRKPDRGWRSRARACQLNRVNSFIGISEQLNLRESCMRYVVSPLCGLRLVRP